MGANTCEACEGTGYADNTTCGTCMGQGSLPITDWKAYVKKYLDSLQADMDIIKPQIQAIYDDLNP